MRNSLLCVVLLVGLLATTIGVFSRAEIPPLRPAELQDLATNIFLGKIVRIYSSVERESPQWEYTYSVAELKIDRVEKGEHSSSLAYVRFWRKRYTGTGPPPPGAYGHRDIPKPGDTARVFVRVADDGGYDVLSPNGLMPVPAAEKQQ
jgi:hypothetical protein